MSQNNAQQNINSNNVLKNSETPNKENKNILESTNISSEGPNKFNNPYLSNNNNSNKKEDQNKNINNPYQIVENSNYEKGNNNKFIESNKNINKERSCNEYSNQNNEQNLNNSQNENFIFKNGANNKEKISNNDNLEKYFSIPNNENPQNIIKNNGDNNNFQEIKLKKEGINIYNNQKYQNNNISNNYENLNFNNNYVHNHYINGNNNINKKNSYKSSSSKDNRKTDLKDFENINTFFSKFGKDPRTALDEYSESTQIKNDTSYLNSVLQLIGHIPNFAFYFLNPKNKNDIDNNIKKNPLSFVTERLFIHLYPFPEKMEPEVYNTHTYLKILGALNLFYDTDKTQRKNPNDLISFVLDTLDKEINYGKSISPANYNKLDVNDAIRAGLQNFSDNIISKTLNWFQLSEAYCQNCQKSIYKVISFNTFNLDIVECYNEKKMSSGNNKISLKDCLDIFNKPICQKLKCYTCFNSFQQIYIKKKILNAPNTFIFLLDRGINFDLASLPLQIPFKIEEEINLENYILNKNSTKKYKLTGIVSILFKEKKYISYCISPITKEWFYYNDEKVEYINLDIILKHHENKENIPCILMYSASK